MKMNPKLEKHLKSLVLGTALAALGTCSHLKRDTPRPLVEQNLNPPVKIEQKSAEETGCANLISDMGDPCKCCCGSYHYEQKQQKEYYRLAKEAGAAYLNCKANPSKERCQECVNDNVKVVQWYDGTYFPSTDKQIKHAGYIKECWRQPDVELSSLDKRLEELEKLRIKRIRPKCREGEVVDVKLDENSDWYLTCVPEPDPDSLGGLIGDSMSCEDCPLPQSRWAKIIKNKDLTIYKDLITSVCRSEKPGLSQDMKEFLNGIGFCSVNFDAQEFQVEYKYGHILVPTEDITLYEDWTTSVCQSQKPGLYQDMKEFLNGIRFCPTAQVKTKEVKPK